MDYERLGFEAHIKSDFDTAMECYKKVLKKNPNNQRTMSLLGELYNDSNRLNESVELLTKVVNLSNDNYAAYHVLGKVLLKQNKVKESIECFETSLKINPKNPLCRTNFSQSLLMDGQFIRGWTENEWRYEAKVYGPSFGLGWNRWEGQDLTGKSIYVVPESGFGDIIQFIRYVPFLKEFGNPKVILGSSPAMFSLLRYIEGIDSVATKMYPTNYQVATMSFPYAFKTTEYTIPWNVPYINIEDSPIDLIQRESGLKVGLVWGGNPFNHLNFTFANMNKIRSVQLEQLAPLAKVKNVSFFSLQTMDNPASKQLENAPFPIINVMENVKDFLDTARILTNLDLVITVDTSIAHLAGAMNIPVWMMSRFGGCWRWMLDRSDSPWYPSMTIFRQPSLGDWKSVVSDVKKELTKLIKEKQ